MYIFSIPPLLGCVQEGKPAKGLELSMGEQGWIPTEAGHQVAQIFMDVHISYIDCFRYVDEPVAQASTSHQHYYSQPGSILAPEPQISKEQLEALIRQQAF